MTSGTFGHDPGRGRRPESLNARRFRQKLVAGAAAQRKGEIPELRRIILRRIGAGELEANWLHGIHAPFWQSSRDAKAFCTCGSRTQPGERRHDAHRTSNRLSVRRGFRSVRGTRNNSQKIWPSSSPSFPCSAPRADSASVTRASSFFCPLPTTRDEAGSARSVRAGSRAGGSGT